MDEHKVCIFCKGTGPFTTNEHIVPEALGNDEDIFSGMVCDKCQNFLGRKVEKPALEKTHFAFWRTFLGIKNKRGNLPSVNLSTQDKGIIPAFHKDTDGIGYTAHEDGSTSIEIDDSKIIRDILEGKKHEFKVALLPWHLNIIGRFLGKMGLEYLATIDYELVLKPAFDELREFVRYNSIDRLWPVFWGKYGDIKDIKSPILNNSQFLEQEVHCFSYALGNRRK